MARNGDGNEDELKLENVVYIHILMTLMNKPSHGYDILKNAEQALGQKLSASHVYPFLRKLKNRGYVEAIETGPRNKKKYRLTKEGKKFARKIMKKFSNLLELFLKPKLNICYHCGSKVFESGIKREGHVFCCEHCYMHYKNEKRGG